MPPNTEMTLARLASSKSMALLPSKSSLKDIIALMINEKRSCVIIGDNQIPLGIITERDVVKFALGALETGDLAKNVTDIMSKELICVSPTTPLSDALALAQYHSVRHLIITSEDRTFAGVIAQSDIVNAYSLLVSTQSKLEDENQELMRLSHQDQLMEIGNRRAMEATLTQLDFQRHHFAIPYSLCLIDVDDFKKYNDHYGHPAGDLALKQLADIIKSTLRDPNMVFRYGGEEILVALTETTLQNAEQAMRRVKSSIDQAAMPHALSPWGVLTVTIGLADSESANGWEQVVEKADQALYSGKKRGKNALNCAT